MKYLFILAFCVAAAIAEDSAEVYRTIQADCLAKNNIHKRDRKDENKLKMTCYYDCLYKGTGMMRQDGSFDIPDIIGPGSAEDNEKRTKEVESVIKACHDQVGTDTCKMASCVHTLLVN